MRRSQRCIRSSLTLISSLKKTFHGRQFTWKITFSFTKIVTNFCDSPKNSPFSVKKLTLYLVKKISPKMVSKKATEKSRFLAIHVKYHLFFHQYFHRHQRFTWNVTIFGEKIVTFFQKKKMGSYLQIGLKVKQQQVTHISDSFLL